MRAPAHLCGPSVGRGAVYGAQCAKEVTKAGLVHPRDRNGRVLMDKYASPVLEDAQEEFRAACAAAAAETRSQLRELASRLRVRTFRRFCCPSH